MKLAASLSALRPQKSPLQWDSNRRLLLLLLPLLPLPVLLLLLLLLRKLPLLLGGVVVVSARRKFLSPLAPGDGDWFEDANDEAPGLGKAGRTGVEVVAVGLRLVALAPLLSPFVPTMPTGPLVFPLRLLGASEPPLFPRSCRASAEPDAGPWWVLLLLLPGK